MESRGIKLGRCRNKYNIIDFFVYAAEEDAKTETEAVLWASSKSHKKFLPKNFSWYPNHLQFKVSWLSLKEQSKQLEYLEQAKFLLNKIRIDGHKEVTKVTLIFTASIQGYKAADFHQYCDMKGPTLCLVRSSEEVLAAGFTSVSWESGYYTKVEDPSAMVFALTNELQAFKTNKPNQAVMHHSLGGPYFYAALCVGNPLNKEHGG